MKIWVREGDLESMICMEMGYFSSGAEEWTALFRKGRDGLYSGRRGRGGGVDDSMHEGEGGRLSKRNAK